MHRKHHVICLQSFAALGVSLSQASINISQSSVCGEMNTPDKFSMTKMIAVALVSLLATAPLAHGEEQVPWTHPEVLKAAWEIGLAPEQRPRFQKGVGDFLEGFGSDVLQLLNSNNQTDLPRKITSKRRSRVRKMDEQMKEILSLRSNSSLKK